VQAAQEAQGVQGVQAAQEWGTGSESGWKVAAGGRERHRLEGEEMEGQAREAEVEEAVVRGRGSYCVGHQRRPVCIYGV
jgi:hypothetical protein